MVNWVLLQLTGMMLEVNFKYRYFLKKKQLKSVWVNRKHLQVAFELPRRAMERLNPNHMPWIGEDCISQTRFLIEAGLCSDLDV